MCTEGTASEHAKFYPQGTCAQQEQMGGDSTAPWPPSHGVNRRPLTLRSAPEAHLTCIPVLQPPPGPELHRDCPNNGLTPTRPDLNTARADQQPLFGYRLPGVGGPPTGATTIGPDATHPPAICQNVRGGGVGGRVGWGGIGSSARGVGPKGGLRATHYYHMHTSRVCVCLGAWGYRGMYAIIAISRLCQAETLKS